METRYRFSAWRAGTKPYLSYWPARLHRLAKSIPRNRCLGSINVYKYGLRARTFKCLWGPGTDSKEWIPPAYVTCNPVRQPYSYSIPSPKYIVLKFQQCLLLPVFFFLFIPNYPPLRNSKTLLLDKGLVPLLAHGGATAGELHTLAYRERDAHDVPRDIL